ncbi:hypothetical protein BZG36_01903 [Bifiguratus adelaidae]|uniref:Uncharacterized protein n=1 Tax=Bifiguratus adelaidae TaxID=1938954 RepID=A0A261Y4J8_9FUNG|nr:hypothetical protein BZG36_01903 [Bifiguratus adelaidae]
MAESRNSVISEEPLDYYMGDLLRPASNLWSTPAVKATGVIFGISFIFSAIYLLLVLIRLTFRRRKRASTESPWRRTSLRRLESFTKFFLRKSPFSIPRPVTNRPTSFGIYLGSFLYFEQDEHIQRILSSYGTLVIDPKQAVIATELRQWFRGSSLLGRIEIPTIEDSSAEKYKSAISELFQRLDALWKPSTTHARILYDGVVLAGWESLPINIINLLITSIPRGYNLKLYLEVTPPDFVRRNDAKLLKLGRVSGFLIHNATIMPETGKRRDYFDLRALRATIELAIKQSSIRKDFTLFFAELVSNIDDVDIAVWRRAFKWSKYYEGITWVAPKFALYQPASHLPRTTSVPMSALEWLRRADLLQIKNQWLSNVTVYEMHEALPMECNQILSHWFPTFQSFFGAHINVADRLGHSHVNHDTGAKTLRSSSILSIPSSQRSRSSTTSTLGSNTQSAYEGIRVNALFGDESSYGVYDLGHAPTVTDFNRLVDIQADLRAKNLLHPIDSSIKDQIIAELSVLCCESNKRRFRGDVYILHDELASIRTLISELESNRICVWQGLDSAFWLKQGRVHFSSVFEREHNSRTVEHNHPMDSISSRPSSFHSDQIAPLQPIRAGLHAFAPFSLEVRQHTHKMHIYVTLKAPHLAAAVLGCYLSASDVSPQRAFLIESMLETPTSPMRQKYPHLSIRVIDQLTKSSPRGLLSILRKLSTSCTKSTNASSSSGNYDVAIGDLRQLCQFLLLDQLEIKQVNGKYLVQFYDGRMTLQELLQKRYEWYSSLDCLTIPDMSDAIRLQQEIDDWMHWVLLNNSYETLQQMTQILKNMQSTSTPSSEALDVRFNLFFFLFFTTLKKYALEDIYVEMTDRNPLLSPFSDQAAVYAELWVIGSKCDLDMTPSELGTILSNRARNDLMARDQLAKDKSVNEISDAFDGVNFMGAYLSANTDTDPEPTSVQADYGPIPKFWVSLTSIGIFCIPAFVDVALLTFHGHGLFMSVAMDPIHVTLASYTMIISLITAGGINGGIGILGSHYLHAMVFPTMSVVLVQMFASGVLINLLIAAIGCIVCGCQYGIVAAYIWLFYTAVFSFFLLVLGTMSTIHMDNIPMQSGRSRMAKSLLILVIAPIICPFLPSRFIILVYFLQLSAFSFCLIVFMRRLFREWNSYLDRIDITDNKTVLDWYIAKHANGNKQCFDKATVPYANKVARTQFNREVQSERMRDRFSKPTDDTLVKEQAESFAFSRFLLEWYCRCNSAPMPLPFSSSWNLQLKVALATMYQYNQALKQHSLGLLWRYCYLEMGYGIIYFFVALLDRWIVLLTGGDIIGLSLAVNGHVDYSLATSFGLMYYLLGSISLEIHAISVYKAIWKKSDDRIRTETQLARSTNGKARRRLHIYIFSLFEYVWSLFFALAISTLLAWLSLRDSEAIIAFFLYIIGYTGVLMMQFNRIFMPGGKATFNVIALAVLTGMIIGCVLRAKYPTFLYTEVICLIAVAWIAAGINFFSADFKLGSSKNMDEMSETPHIVDLRSKKNNLTSGQRWIGNAHRPKCAAQILDDIQGLRPHLKVEISPHGSDTLGCILDDILQHALSLEQSETLHNAFDGQEKLIFQKSLEDWKSGRTRIVVVPRTLLAAYKGAEYSALAHIDPVTQAMIIYAGVPDISKSWLESDFARSTHMQIAEALVHETCEMGLGTSHTIACVSELLLHGDVHVPERVSEQISWMTANTLSDGTDNVVLNHLALGIDIDTDWDNLPSTVRRVVVDRVTLTANSPMVTDELEGVLEAQRAGELKLSTTGLVAIHDACVRLAMAVRAKLCQECDRTMPDAPIYNGQWTQKEDIPDYEFQDLDHVDALAKSGKFLAIVQDAYGSILSTGYYASKFLLFATSGNIELPREIDFASRKLPNWMRAFVIVFHTRLSMVGRPFTRFWIERLLWHYRPALRRLNNAVKSGIKIVRTPDCITIHDPRSSVTGFFDIPETDILDLQSIPLSAPKEGLGNRRVAMVLRQYEGILKSRPKNDKNLKAIGYYDKKEQLLRQCKFSNGKLQEDAFYYYRDHDASTPRRFPHVKVIEMRDGGHESFFYDEYGRVNHGSIYRKRENFTFRYTYHPKPENSDNLIKAIFLGTHISYEVYWCAIPVKKGQPVNKQQKWIPFHKVTRVTWNDGVSNFETVWVYEHKRHPQISTLCDGQPIETPNHIIEDVYRLFVKPDSVSFLKDDILAPLNAPAQNRGLLKFARHTTNARRGRLTVNKKVNTHDARSLLWKTWQTEKNVEGVHARILDEMILRNEPLLKQYWAARDRGAIQKARSVLKRNEEAIVAAMYIDDSVSGMTLLAFKISDLYAMGAGGDTNLNTRSPLSNVLNNDKEVSVLATDTGTFPIEAGGVSNCRRDVVDGLKDIRWHFIAEAANDLGTPKFQVEKNVQSVKILPLWGLDFLTPSHGVVENLIDGQVEERIFNTTSRVIEHFIPHLVDFVKGCRTITFTEKNVQQFTRSLVALNTFFGAADWNRTWNDSAVRKAWREAWIMDGPNLRSTAALLEIECPTEAEFDECLEMFKRYLFILSVAVPEVVPPVFQSTHHSVSAMFGIVVKFKRGSTFMIWDHGISWRECTSYLSAGQCLLSPFVQNSLLGLMRLAATLTLYHADIVLPCTNLYNPDWETEIGTGNGSIMHRRTFQKKIDPVVNGIANMEKYEPPKELTSKVPTVVMLSHLMPVKDPKSAILATDVIVNEFGFRDYALDIYGAVDRTPWYTVECQELIAMKGIGEYVKLRGYGNASQVLATAWAFMNSSITEGLPLALGEAGLSGAPIVCTSVGATSTILQDPSNPNKMWGETVPPNSPHELARAQLRYLAMLDDWAQYAHDEYDPADAPTRLPEHFTSYDVQWITKRMYDKSPHRRKVALNLRKIVQVKFSGDRYLREHEQMLFIGKYRYNQALESPKAASGYGRHVAIPMSSPLYSDMLLSPTPAPGFGGLYSGAVAGLESGVAPTPLAHLKGTATPTSLSSVSLSENEAAKQIRHSRLSNELSHFFTGQYQRSESSVGSVITLNSDLEGEAIEERAVFGSAQIETESENPEGGSREKNYAMPRRALRVQSFETQEDDNHDYISRC